MKLGSVLLIGGSGSWGTACAKRLLQDPLVDRIIIYSRGEHRQEELARELAPLDAEGRVRMRIGDVRDRERLEMAMRDVDHVFHAAALKIVPACESDPIEAIRTNVVGAQNVIQAALHCGVKKVIALSTDKAAAASTLYGATKYCAERLFVASNVYAGGYGTKFACVRYGNVIGSRSSVVPLFQNLIASGATSLPITDPRMTRFWWSIEEAVEFTLRSMKEVRGGEVFIPKIKARRIVDVARELAPGLPHRIIGIRPGEKLHELLISEDEARNAVEFPDHFILVPPGSGSWRGNWVPDGFRYSSEDALVEAAE